MNLLEVKIWDRLVGVIVWNETSSSTSFEYSKEFIKSEIELPPLINPLSTKIIKSKNIHFTPTQKASILTLVKVFRCLFPIHYQINLEQNCLQNI